MSKEQDLIDMMTENFGMAMESPIDEEPNEVVIIED